MAVNKLVYFGETLFDATPATVDVSTLLKGATAIDKTGTLITGTCTFDSDTSDADALRSEILNNKTAYVNGAKVTGTMVNNGGQDGTIGTKSGSYIIPVGYHDGSGKVTLINVEELTASNIRKGCTILGVSGNLEEGAQEIRQERSVTPSKTQQIIAPESGYTCLSKVTVAAIPYTSTNNSAGGQTITIG